MFFIFIKALLMFVFFFFFQAEDGIRDLYVTGVQTCALPILHVFTNLGLGPAVVIRPGLGHRELGTVETCMLVLGPVSAATALVLSPLASDQIGRASCRERV